MNGRERFKRAMSHTTADRPPIDLGATTLTAMSAGCQRALRAHLGLPGEPVLSNSGVDERILQWAGTDFRGVGAIVRLPSVHTRRGSPNVTVDCWGVRRGLVGGYHEITHHPLKGATVQDLQDFTWPEPRIDPRLLEHWQHQARTLHEAGEYAVVAEHPVFGILELGCWMCGYDDFLMRLAGDPDFVRRFFDRALEIQLKVVTDYYSALGPYIDLTTSGDDFGMQTGPLVSPYTFERLISPYFATRIARTKELAHCYYWHHTCGSVVAILDQMIDCGVDILNPVQTSAAGMDPAALKDRFGDRLVFWGALDVQQFLPNATPEEVSVEVTRLIATLGNGGGYVVAPAHNMQDDVPPENIVAWIEAAQQPYPAPND